jgi:hypothetical protein
LASIKNIAILSSLWVDDRAYNDVYGNNTYAPNTTGYSPNQPFPCPLVFAKPKTSMSYGANRGRGYGRTQLQLTDTSTGFVGQNVDAATYEVLGSGTTDPASTLYGQRVNYSGGYKAGNESYGHFGNQTVKVKKAGHYLFIVNLPLMCKQQSTAVDFSRVKVQLWVDNTIEGRDFYGTDFLLGDRGSGPYDIEPHGRQFANSQYTVIKKLEAGETFQIRVQGLAKTYNGSNGKKFGDNDGTLPWNTRTLGDDWERVAFADGGSPTWVGMKGEDPATIFVERIDDSDKVAVLHSTQTEDSASSNFRPNTAKDIRWNETTELFDTQTYELSPSSWDSIKVKKTGWYFLATHTRYKFSLDASNSAPIASYQKILVSDTNGSNYIVPTSLLPSYIRPASATVYRSLEEDIYNNIYATTTTAKNIDQHGTLNYSTFIQLTAGEHIKFQVCRENAGSSITQATYDGRSQLILRYYGASPNGLTIIKGGSPEEIGRDTGGNSSADIWNYDAFWANPATALPTLAGWSTEYEDTTYWDLISNSSIKQKKAGHILMGFGVGLDQSTNSPTGDYLPKSSHSEVILSAKPSETTLGYAVSNSKQLRVVSVTGFVVGDYIGIGEWHTGNITAINVTTNTLTIDKVAYESIGAKVAQNQGSKPYTTSQQAQNFYSPATKQQAFMGSVGAITTSFPVNAEYELSSRGLSWVDWDFYNGPANLSIPQFNRATLGNNEPPRAWFLHLLDIDQGSGSGQGQSATAAGSGVSFAVHTSASVAVQGQTASATSLDGDRIYQADPADSQAQTASAISNGDAWSSATGFGSTQAQPATVAAEVFYTRHDGAGSVVSAQSASATSTNNIFAHTGVDLSVSAASADTVIDSTFAHTGVDLSVSAASAIGWGNDPLNDHIHRTVGSQDAQADSAVSLSAGVYVITGVATSPVAQSASADILGDYILHGNSDVATQSALLSATASKVIQPDCVTQSRAGDSSIGADLLHIIDAPAIQAQPAAVESVSDLSDVIHDNNLGSVVDAQAAETIIVVEGLIHTNIGGSDTYAQTATASGSATHIFKDSCAINAQTASTTVSAQKASECDASINTQTAQVVAEGVYWFEVVVSTQAQPAIGWGNDPLNDHIHRTVGSQDAQADSATVVTNIERIIEASPVSVSAVSATSSAGVEYNHYADVVIISEDASISVGVDLIHENTTTTVGVGGASVDCGDDLNSRIVQGSVTIQAQSATVVSSDSLQDLIHDDNFGSDIIAGSATAISTADYAFQVDGGVTAQAADTTTSAQLLWVGVSSIQAQSATVVSSDSLQDLIHDDNFGSDIIAGSATVTSADGSYIFTIAGDVAGQEVVTVGVGLYRHEDLGSIVSQSATTESTGFVRYSGSSSIQAQSATVVSSDSLQDLIHDDNFGTNLTVGVAGVGSVATRSAMASASVFAQESNCNVSNDRFAQGDIAIAGQASSAVSDGERGATTDVATEAQWSTTDVDGNYIFCADPIAQAQSATVVSSDSEQDLIHDDNAGSAVECQTATTSCFITLRRDASVAITSAVATINSWGAFGGDIVAVVYAQDALGAGEGFIVSNCVADIGGGIATAVGDGTHTIFGSAITQAQSASVISSDSLQDLIHDDNIGTGIESQTASGSGVGSKRQHITTDASTQEASIDVESDHLSLSTTSDIGGQVASVVGSADCIHLLDAIIAAGNASTEATADSVSHSDVTVSTATAQTTISANRGVGISTALQADSADIQVTALVGIEIIASIRADSAVAAGTGYRSATASPTVQAQAATVSVSLGLLAPPSIGYDVNMPSHTYVIFTTLD